MQKTYSIAEARNQFAKLVRYIEQLSKPIKVTRRGKPVAVILSIDEYERLQSRPSKPDFWEAYLEYQKQWENIPMDIEDDVWADVRDKSPGREINPWE